MSETMVERMARAYWWEWRQRWERVTGEAQPEWDALPENSRLATECCFAAALNAMREPTQRILDAGINRHSTLDSWQAMIDAALSEAEHKD